MFPILFRFNTGKSESYESFISLPSCCYHGCRISPIPYTVFFSSLVEPNTRKGKFHQYQNDVRNEFDCLIEMIFRCRYIYIFDVPVLLTPLFIRIQFEYTNIVGGEYRDFVEIKMAHLFVIFIIPLI